MQRHIGIAAALLTSGLFVGGSVGAAETGFYAGASAGQSTIKEEFAGGFDFDESVTGWKVFAGARFGLFGVEGGYVNFGDTSAEILGTDIDVEVDGFDLFGTANLDAGPATLFAKAGAINWNVDVNGIDADDNGTDFAYGFGASFSVTPSTAIRAEYELFEVGDIDEVSMFSVGFDYSF